MAIQVKRGDLQRQADAGLARIRLAQPVQVIKPAPEVTHEPQLAAAIEKIASALAAAKQEQRADILRAISVNEQIASALLTLRAPGWSGNWNVNITKRDALGRISEVQFRPAKP